MINIRFYGNFSTTFSIIALALPLTFNYTFCLSNPKPLPLCFNYFCKYFPFQLSCNVCTFYFCIVCNKLDIFKVTHFIICTKLALTPAYSAAV